jgi:hypothetical protein
MAWSPLVELVTLDQAKAHLKLPLDLTAEDDDLNLKLLIAHEVVMDYLTQRLEDEDTVGDWEAEVDAWTAGTAPKRVLGAILDQFAQLYRYRGDEPGLDPNAISPGAASLLKRFRDPAVS